MPHGRIAFARFNKKVVNASTTVEWRMPFFATIVEEISLVPVLPPPSVFLTSTMAIRHSEYGPYIGAKSLVQTQSSKPDKSLGARSNITQRALTN